MNSMKAIDKLLEEAERLVWIEIEKEVHKILLSKRNRAVTFITAMGGWFFVDDEGDFIDDKRWMFRIYQLYEKYNQAFHMFGAGIRWDLNEAGEVIKCTHW